MSTVPTLRSSETLSGIARRFPTTVDSPAKAHPVQSPAPSSTARQGTVADGFDTQARRSSGPQAADGFDAGLTSPAESATAARAANFSVPQNDLERGMQGPEVEQLQSALVSLGYMTQAQKDTGPGIFGPQTEASLKSFQADHGVPSTGYYGPLTRAALTQRAGGPGPVGPTPEPGGAGSVSVEQLRAIMPNLSDARARELMPHLNAAMEEAGINTPRRQAAFLAQLAHESGEFRWMEELASGADYEGRLDLGNTEPGDGMRYKGRGPIQLTGRSNYRAAGQALGIDLENNPTRAADPDVGFRTAAWYWNNRNLNQYADAGNFDAITYRVNGGYNGKAERDAYYARALQVLGG
jgi:predicted chitinase